MSESFKPIEIAQYDLGEVSDSELDECIHELTVLQGSVNHAKQILLEERHRRMGDDVFRPPVTVQRHPGREAEMHRYWWQMEQKRA